MRLNLDRDIFLIFIVSFCILTTLLLTSLP